MARRSTPGKLVELDTFEIPEAMDPDNAEGFGDLSVHEAATSPTVPHRIYFSYYSGGFRVLEIQNEKLVEVGHFIDVGGNDFWGVQVFSRVARSSWPRATWTSGCTSSSTRRSRSRQRGVRPRAAPRCA